MKLKSTGGIFLLIFRLLYYFIMDRTYFKKLILHSGRELWYLIIIIILSAMIASLIGQITLMKLKEPEPIKCPMYEDIVSPLKEELERYRITTCPSDTPNPPKPKIPVPILPPKVDRKEHDLESLLDKIR